MQFTYSNANFFLGWYIWFCPLRREDKSWALVERKKTFDIPNKLTQNLTPNRYAYSNTQFKSSYTLHPQKHRQHAQGAHGGYKKERDKIRTHTSGSLKGRSRRGGKNIFCDLKRSNLVGDFEINKKILEEDIKSKQIKFGPHRVTT